MNLDQLLRLRRANNDLRQAAEAEADALERLASPHVLAAVQESLSSGTWTAGGWSVSHVVEHVEIVLSVDADGWLAWAIVYGGGDPFRQHARGDTPRAAVVALRDQCRRGQRAARVRGVCEGVLR